MREAGAAIFFHPCEREIDARRNTGGRVDVSVFHPERIVLDADTWISCCHFTAKSPMRGRSAVIQQARFGEQKGADTYRTSRRTSAAIFFSQADSAASRTDRVLNPQTRSMESQAPSTLLK